ncbi:hypothetical protein BVRB_6g142000 [Beta vulgaris subsp. vulgaris]|nr:hypothetical protein BVRB_6g142000 [Beta vulgaris subsp. vulgaris]
MQNNINLEKTKRHDIPRHQVHQVICSLCGTEQEVRQVCVNCGVCMGKYYCEICKLYDDNVADETAKNPRQATVLSSHHQHALEEVHPREATSAINPGAPRLRTAQTPAGPLDMRRPALIRSLNKIFQQLADRLSDNFERGLRALILNFQAGGEGISNMPPLPPMPRLVVDQNRARNLDEPQVIALDPPNSPYTPRRSQQVVPSKGDARDVINERHLTNDNRDAREVLNEKRAQSKARNTPPIPNRKQREPRE